MEPAQGVQHGAVKQGRPVAGDQRIQAGSPGFVDLAAIVLGEQPERRARDAALGIERAGDLQRPPELREVVLVAERRILVEPLRSQHLRRRAAGLPPVLQGDPDTHEGLGRLREGDDAKAKGHAEPDAPLQQTHLFDPQSWSAHALTISPA